MFSVQFFVFHVLLKLKLQPMFDNFLLENREKNTWVISEYLTLLFERIYMFHVGLPFLQF